MTLKERYAKDGAYIDLKHNSLQTEDEAYNTLAKASSDYHFFCKSILGSADMNIYHYELCRFIQFNHHKYKLCLMPRYTFKSCVITQGYSLWNMWNNPNIRILIYSDCASKAEKFLLGIKNHIEGKTAGSRLREFAGINQEGTGWEVASHKDKWNESQINISTRTVGHVEPTVDTGGIETSKTGMHYDMIIFDDIVSDINVTTRAQMDKVHECYKKALSLLKPGGEVVMVGTRWHFGDTYGRLIAENEEKDTFGIFIKQAKVNNEYLFADIGPEALTQSRLEHLKREQGTYVWSCLYQNNPISDEQAMFKKDDFQFYGELKKSNTPDKTGLYENLFITGTMDPSGDGNDYSAGTVVGTDHSKRMYILELFNDKEAKPSHMIDWILRMNNKYHFRKFGIEITFFRGMFKRELEDRIAKEREKNYYFSNFSIEEFKTRWRSGEGKKLRIESMQPYHERGGILFPGKSVEGQSGEFGDLVTQMLQVTGDHMPEPNDLIDALSWQIELVQKGGRQEQAGPPKNSPAWLEQGWVEEHNKLQRRLPRRYRQYAETMLS
jgi:hypothetical protein